jgi:hypothetical protein
MMVRDNLTIILVKSGTLRLKKARKKIQTFLEMRYATLPITHKYIIISVPDLDPYVFGPPPGSRSGFVIICADQDLESH